MDPHGPGTAQLPREPEIERDVALVVEDFTRALGSLPPAAGVTAGDVLDRDLGIGSLERVELLYRLETAFGVRFPDRVMAETETVGDLVRAVRDAGPAPAARAAPPPPVFAPTATRGHEAPAAVRTLTEALRWHVEAAPERPHVVLRPAEGAEISITYGDLWRRAAGVAAGLRERGVEAGESVAVMLRTEPAFFFAFFGTLLAGAVPVPIYPPVRVDRLEEYANRQTGILANSRARLLVTFSEAARVAAVLRPRLRDLRDVVTTDSLALPAADASARVRGGEPALIQYTSGSTGDPKGVLLTHDNLLANVRALGEALGVGPEDVVVSWLPLYHDMGLIGAWLGALYHGVPAVIMPPLAFLARPARWLEAIHAHRGTLSPAPNFAFDLCVRRIADAELDGLDLSCWRLALNGSEPVSPDTMGRFAARFAARGFRPEAMCPVYGLAEASVGLTVTPPGRGPRIDQVSREAFTRERVARPALAGEAGVLRFVSCGRPLPGHEIRIVDAAGRPAGERVEGGVEFRGPSVTAGYFGRPEATRAVWHDGWMDSGDLGYWADGELYVTGRRKDMITRAGRNLYPQEIEEVVGDLPGVRKGCVAAFGVPDPATGTERLVVVAESRVTEAGARARLAAAVHQAVMAALGVPADAVEIAPPGAVLKTSSGKVRRSATRAAYLRGRLARRRAPVVVQRLRLAAGNAVARLGRAVSTAALLAGALRTGLVVATTMPVLWALVALVPRGRPVDVAVKRWSRLALALCGCPLRVEGAARLGAMGPVVLAPNHASYIDAVVLFAALPTDFRFVAKRELLDTPLIGTVVRKVGHLTVERADVAQSVADASRVVAELRAGRSLVIFPEGTFVAAPGLLPFRLGAFHAAVEAGRPIVPVVLRGTRRVLPADTWLPRPGPIEVIVGEPIAPSETGWRETVRLRDLTRAAIAVGLDPDEAGPASLPAGTAPRSRWS